MTNNLEPLGIYIHIPFCLHKCYYCDFYSIPLLDSIILDSYSKSVIKDLHRRAAENVNPFSTVYLGGGTPSLMPVAQVGKIIESIFAKFQPAGEIEISMEVNPATVDIKYLRELRTVGVNRLSIGIQSFSDVELKMLGRIHGAGEAVRTLDAVRKAGFDNINLDLIYGVPGQTLASWQETLSWALKFNPQHISAYLLQLDESTPMAQKVKTGALRLLDDELESNLYYAALNYLHEEGYQHYEISNFARQGYECRHNLFYWQGREYLGIGSGAVSYIKRQRTLTSPDVYHYIEAMQADLPAPADIMETMDLRQQMADAIIMGLRLTRGIKREEFLQRFNMDVLEEYRDIINTFREQGLLELENGRIYLSKQAYFLSNQVLSQFIA